MGPRAYRWIAVLLLPLMTGCIGLKNKAVTAVHADLTSVSVCPGGSVDLLLGIELDDGKVLRPAGASGGSVGWRNLRVHVEGGATVGSRGAIRVSPDPADTWGKPVRWSVTLPDHPGVEASGTVGIRYDCDYTAWVGGRSGDSGDGGIAGDDGDEQSPVGLDGQDGQDGQDGEDGHRATVLVAYAIEPISERPVLQTEVRFGTGELAGRFALDPDRGSLHVDASGGNGGAGGDGGDGGDSSACIDGVSRALFRGGNGGDGGDGGRGGDAGAVRMLVDARAAKLVRNLHVDLSLGRGGDAGSAGAGGDGTCGKDGKDGRSGRFGRSGREGREPRVDLDHVAPFWK
ncbi:MAG: hypothetical protein GY898_21380 [Proteobacteria bacterium]|nr:hypothetical protein [Pseudomonadota bacterium]